MSIIWREMVTGATLTSTIDPFYTAPSITSASIQAVSVYNPTGSPITFSLYKVPNGSSADSTKLICTRSVPSGALVMANEAINHKLQPGTQLYASGNGLTMNISGVEYVPE